MLVRAWRRYLLALATLAALALSSTASVSAAGGTPTTRLTGTWQVTRTCTSGCTGTTVLTEHVVARDAGVYAATGDVTQLLYAISARRVLTHAAKSSSLLTVKVPGETMRGLGVADDGSTFTVVWECISSSPAAARTRAKYRLAPQPLGRAIC